ncbi:sensor histidine kinase [Psychroserpens algicola]|uniref:sensor histidine kinase n=1 Tax=Psychroserpens algicola TaxID=1719034 RepID=UPI001952BAC6|nr:HAMP domain-containing sensor histidine kinase [Psychroserpens algicola]
MNDSKYSYILYVIIIVIISTIGIQAYWNYKNYLTSKQQVINDVQVSLDKAVDDYYANLAENSTIGFSIKEMSQKDFLSTGRFDSILKSIESNDTDGFGSIDSIPTNLMEGISIVKGVKADSILEEMHLKSQIHFSNEQHPQLKSIEIDSFSTYSKKEGVIDLSEKDFKFLTSKVIISMTTDSLSLHGLDTLLQSEFRRKDINIDYTIKYLDPSNDIDYYNTHEKNIEVLDPKTYANHLVTTSKSTFLPKHSELSLLFSNVSSDIFKRIIWGILISSLLVLAVISCLFYLLSIIKHQKQLAEVKNDLISNITHEFKTPIATIGVALESIQNFNAIEDRAKTKTYLDMSQDQLSKLNTMVEKLLETATLDTDNLKLNIDNYNISDVITNMTTKFKLQHSNKTITTRIAPDVFANVDIFHFENAINNIIDNAYKYGGDTIQVSLKSSKSQIDIAITDNGTSLSNANKDQIFEKFYRVPKGNTHDVKGYGIGLYYAKTIIEKHNGSIGLDLKNKLTTFNISLPNV